ncbi:MAG: hypothetical protein ACXWQE_04650 [Bdellovibrionales bacterium]
MIKAISIAFAALMTQYSVNAYAGIVVKCVDGRAKANPQEFVAQTIDRLKQFNVVQGCCVTFQGVKVDRSGQANELSAYFFAGNDLSSASSDMVFSPTVLRTHFSANRDMACLVVFGNSEP